MRLAFLRYQLWAARRRHGLRWGILHETPWRAAAPNSMGHLNGPSAPPAAQGLLQLLLSRDIARLVLLSSRYGGPLRRHTLPHVHTRSCHPTPRTVHGPAARARDSSAGPGSSGTRPWLRCRGCGVTGLAHRRDGRRRPDSRAGRGLPTAIPTDLQPALASGLLWSTVAPFDGPT